MNPIRLDASSYRTAEQLLRHNRGELVLNGSVRPRWLEDGVRFWYPTDTVGGPRFHLVDPVKGSRKPAFDHARLATALAAASGSEVDAAELPFGAFDVTGEAVEFDAFGARWRCALDDYTCVAVEERRPANSSTSSRRTAATRCSGRRTTSGPDRWRTGGSGR